MDGDYLDHASRKPMHSGRIIQYTGVLIAAKFLCAFGIFVTYDLLKLIHIVQLLFLVKLGSAIVFLLIQKPFTSGKRLNKRQWLRLTRHAVIDTFIHLLWLFGLTQCGPFRSLLLYEHSDTVVLAAAAALLTSNSTPAKFRGAVFFLFAVTGILLFDHDDILHHLREGVPEDHHREAHSGILSHIFDHMTQMTGLSDHKGGVFLLLTALCLKAGFHKASRSLSIDLGGQRRVHALSGLLSTLILLPWATFVTVTQESVVTSWLSMLVPLLIIIFLVFVLNFYIELACSARLEAPRAHRTGAISIFLSGFLLSMAWNHPFVSQITTLSTLQDVIREDHVLSGGVVFSLVLFIFATVILTSPNRSVRGAFIGYSVAGKPLYNYLSIGDRFEKTSHSLMQVARSGLTSILENSDSRKIFYFLCINLFFTFVELVYGAWTNSLGLISDGFHMLFDCSALVMGLYAAVMSRWPATRVFSYGYDRVEVLSGFINSLFLVVIAFFVFSAALARVFDPPEINTERLLAVSVAGLVVNLFGILAFHGAHGHSHGGHGHSHGGHGHSHGGHGHSHGGHGHSHGGHGHSHSGQGGKSAVDPVTHNTNMEGVFLHVLADTLGSVGVIISSLLIEYFGWTIADPVCSLFIATLIFISVVPLVKETSTILLLRTPPELEDAIADALAKIQGLPGVTSVSGQHFWRQSSKVVCAMLHVESHPDVPEQKVITEVTAVLKEAGVTNVMVQVKKPAFNQHMMGLCGHGIIIENFNYPGAVDRPSHKGL